MESRLRDYYEKQSTFNSFQGKGGRIDGKKKGTKGKLSVVFESYCMTHTDRKTLTCFFLYPDKKGKKQLLIGLPIIRHIRPISAISAETINLQSNAT